MTKSVVEILKEARELISVPERWCRDWYAKDSTGRNVDVVAHDACRWCARGAIQKVCGGSDHWDAIRLLGAIAQQRGYTSIAELNDRGRHPTVLKAFDLAISKAEAGQ